MDGRDGSWFERPRMSPLSRKIGPRRRAVTSRVYLHPFDGTPAQARSNVALAVRMGACTVESKTAALPLGCGRDRDRGLPIAGVQDRQAHLPARPRRRSNKSSTLLRRKKSGSLSPGTWRLDTLYRLQEAKNFWKTFCRTACPATARARDNTRAFATQHPTQVAVGG